MAIKLPCPKSIYWAHSTNSPQSLAIALNDLKISAIEADILMGHCTEENRTCDESSNYNETTQSRSNMVPIMAHPPSRISSLSLQSFLSLILNDTKKHIKLDMKESKAVSHTLTCLLTQIENSRVANQENTVIFLNADIFTGPGCRNSLGCVEASGFVVQCKEFVAKMTNLQKATKFDFALSLGFKVDYKSNEKYTEEDCSKMIDLVRSYCLDDDFGTFYSTLQDVLTCHSYSSPTFINRSSSGFECATTLSFATSFRSVSQ